MFGFGKQELKTYDYSAEEMASFQWAKMTTGKGVMWLKLYNEEAPNTVANFATLAKDGFYDGLNFHRVIPGFMAQGGCPHGTGTGGPGWSIACETDKNVHKHVKGTLSMAHAGPNTGGSQFFINLVDNTYLDWDDPRTPSAHPVFGEVVGGMDVVDRIGKVKTDSADRPKVAVRITKAEVVER